MEMSEKLQKKLWEEAKCFRKNASKKHVTKFGVTNDGTDNQYMELSFSCSMDEDYDNFIDIINNEFLQIIRYEYPNVKIQEFEANPIEISDDREDWQHVIQLSMGNEETIIENKFNYWQLENEKIRLGIRDSTKEGDIGYVGGLKKWAKTLNIKYEYNNDIYKQMIIIEDKIKEYFMVRK